MSPCWKRAGSARAMPAATPRSSAPTICLPANIQFYEWSMKLWEGLEQDLNYNVMVSQRGVLNLYHSDAQRDAFARRGNAMRLNGVDAELLDRRAGRRRCCRFSISTTRAFRSMAGLLQRPRRHGAPRRGRLGLCARRRPARRRHHPELRGDRPRIRNGRVAGVETTRGTHPRGEGRARGRRQFLAACGDGRACACRSRATCCRPSSPKASSRLIDCVITFGAGHFYISQSDKGGLVFGGDIDGYNSYAQRGNLPTVEDIIEGGMALWPILGRLRVLRHWGGIIDMTMDGSPDHRPHADRRPLSQRRLVLRRLQGDAGFRLVLRPPDRPRRTARAERGLPPRPLRHRRV